MKNKIKLLGIIALVALIGFSIAACDGDSDSSSGGGNSSSGGNASLVGTKWTRTLTDKGYEYTGTIQFTSATDLVITSVSNNPNFTPFPEYYKYSYSGNTVTFMDLGGSFLATGTISGNKLSINNDNGVTEIYTKE